MEISIADTQEQVEQVQALTAKIYKREGFHDINYKPTLFNNDKNTKIFIATDGPHLLGSVSTTLNSPLGLPIFDNFKSHVDIVSRVCHKHNQKLGCAWRIVASQHEKPLHTILCLIDRALRYAIETNVDMTLFAFHPRHVKFYLKALCLVEIAKISQPSASLMIGYTKDMTNCWSILKERWI